MKFDNNNHFFLKYTVEGRLFKLLFRALETLDIMGSSYYFLTVLLNYPIYYFLPIPHSLHVFVQLMKLQNQLPEPNFL